MHRITVVATSHRPIGKCNPDELYNIIERIAPDVIFEEVPPSRFVSVYRGQLTDSMETETIKRYLQENNIAHVPVDNEIDDLTARNLRNAVGQLFDVVERTSHDYSILREEHQKFIKADGFTYLNSERCAALLQTQRQLEKEILIGMNQPHYKHIYNEWLRFNELRERIMVENIHEYSRNNRYDTGLFLVGAEHKKSIRDRVRAYSHEYAPELTWRYYQ